MVRRDLVGSEPAPPLAGSEHTPTRQWTSPDWPCKKRPQPLHSRSPPLQIPSTQDPLHSRSPPLQIPSTSDPLHLRSPPPQIPSTSDPLHFRSHTRQVTASPDPEVKRLRNLLAESKDAESNMHADFTEMEGRLARCAGYMRTMRKPYHACLRACTHARTHASKHTVLPDDPTQRHTFPHSPAAR